MEGVLTSSKPVFSWEDPFYLDRQLSEDERMVRDTARQFAREVLLPRVIDDFREERFDKDMMRQMGALGLLGPTIPETYGGAGVNHVAYGLAAHEIEAIDSGYRSAMSVQSSLVMHPIHEFGTEAQKQKFLPKLASGEMIGCFGLTEPDYGSDPGGMVTKAVKVDGGYHLSGAKMWISNAPIADIAVVWAKLDGVIRGFVIERETAGAGFSTPKIEGKLSLRASVTGSIQMDNAFVSEDNMFPEVTGLKGPFSCLNKARYGIAWGTLGAAQFCYDAARSYTLDRKQFNRPLAANQLVQLKLADMHTEISIGLQACLRVGRLLDEGNCPPENISTIKRNSYGKALAMARVSRDMHGGNGIAEEYHVMRHVMNLETVNTYEGTHDVHALIIVGAPSLAGQMIGVMLVLSGCAFWALGQVLIRRLGDVMGGFQLTAWIGMIAAPQMFVASLLFEGNPLPLVQAAPVEAWFTVLYLGLVMTVIGYSAWYYVLARYPVAMVMPVLLLLPVSTILGAVTFLGERPDAWVLIGGAVVVTGVGVVIIDPKAMRTAAADKKAAENRSDA